ncbi:metalloprotease [Plectosphaerella plurivora]|uniref:Metalloprotease n=1 Tax=Plectosphaerella plurivora TaxID=936078 RepID=A0A9P8V6U8_9PEZI|nr:metalloprotease [Plectosphaerella plurivora]
MRSFEVLAVLAAIAKAASAQAKCVTDEPTAEILSVIDDLRAKERHVVSARQAGNLTVPVYFHAVVSPGQENLIPEEQLDLQFATLAADFAPNGIHLTHAGSTRTVDASLAQGPFGGGDDFQAFLRSHRQGDYGTLNMYFYTDMDPGVSGYCRLPAWGGAEEPWIWDDGCHILAATLPGEGEYLGKTATHEAGHWFGLLHTFQGNSCNPFAGDMVDDTPQERVSSSGCQIGKDSCPDVPGLDPIHNYMDYSADTCVTEFTPGQAVRMHDMYSSLRTNLASK